MSSSAVRQANVRSSSSVLDRYRAVRAETLLLVAPLSPEDLMVQSCPEASPAKWHLAHTSWFFETFVLRDFVAGYQDFHPDFHWLFNSYYNSLGDMPAKSLRSSFSRPAIDDILRYREYVDAAIAKLLQSQPDYPANAESVRRIVMGLEHEQQHQELIATDIKHALFTNPLHPAYRESFARAEVENIAPPVEWLTFDAGVTQVGYVPDDSNLESFCFDNETPRHRVYIAPFSIASRPVTCAEYLAFIEDGGYTRPELWLSDGWATIREHGWHAPLYWQQDLATNSGWRIYTLTGWRSMDDLSETPVCHLSFFEADAFARWASRQTSGVRLPTESEWEYAAAQLGTLVRGAPRRPELLTYPMADDSAAIAATPANMLEMRRFHPTRASARKGLQQMFGDVWEWTSSAYTGYPGYRPLPGALGEYNGKFMSSQMVLRGGSCVTPATHIRASYRNFFAPVTRWQFSGLRLARDIA